MDFKQKMDTTAFCRILCPLDGHLWSHSGPEGNLQHSPASFSGCQHTAPQSALELRGKRQLLPPSFPSSRPNELQTGFPHRFGTLSNAPRCRVCPLPGYYCEQQHFFPPHPQAWGWCILPNPAGQKTFLNYSSKCEQPVLELQHAASSLRALREYGQLSLENYVFKALWDWSLIAYDHPEEKTARTGQQLQLLTSSGRCISHIFIQGLTCIITTSIFHLTFMTLKIQLKGTLAHRLP